MSASSGSQLWGQRLPDAEIKELMSLEKTTLKYTQPGGVGAELDVFPWLRHVPSAAVRALYGVRDRLQQ